MGEQTFIDLLRKTKWSKWAHRFSVTLQGLLKIKCRHPALDFTRNRISWSFWPTEKAGQVGGQEFANLWPPACQNQRAKMARWRESRGNALPSDMMLCVISYWVLSGAPQAADSAAKLLRTHPAKKSKWRDVYLKLTRHNGRAGTHGTYNPKHNDRSFNLSNSEHIDPERAKSNIYWDCPSNK